MTYRISFELPDAIPITEDGDTNDPISFMKQRLARFLYEHAGEWTPGTVLIVRFETPAE
jgi:hypothetical protein